VAGRKNSMVTVAARIQAIRNAISEGATTGEIIEAASRQFAVSKEQIRSDLKGIRKRWKRAASRLARNNHDQTDLVRALERRGWLMRRAIEAGQLAVALAAEESRTRLVGLDKDNNPVLQAAAERKRQAEEKRKEQEARRKAEAEAQARGESTAGRLADFTRLTSEECEQLDQLLDKLYAEEGPSHAPRPEPARAPASAKPPGPEPEPPL
jgi:hypothetical protein